MTAREGDLRPALTRFTLVDDAMPVMLAYVDAEERYRYHNRAFREWIGADIGRIVGRTMLEVLGDEVYSEIAHRIAQAMGGQAMRYERTHKSRSGGAQRLFIHLVPHVGEDGRVVGVFALVIDQGRRTRSGPAAPSAPAAAAPTVADAQSLYDESIDMDLTGWQNAADRIKSALKNDEFILYAQPIRDLNDDSRRFYEIFLRIEEEEENMMPPGAFLPLAEKYGLMRELDRWTVAHVLAMAAARRHAGPHWEKTAYCVTLSGDSIADPYFPDFIQAELAAHDIPGEALRFQFHVGDIEANPADAAHLVQELTRLGCWSVLSGFGRDKVDFDRLKDIPVGFLKIDSSIIYRILRDDSALATLKSINRVAHTVGINTIAELVESAQALEVLREVGVDYAQGLAIGSPVPLQDILGQPEIFGRA